MGDFSPPSSSEFRPTPHPDCWVDFQSPASGPAALDAPLVAPSAACAEARPGGRPSPLGPGAARRSRWPPSGAGAEHGPARSGPAHRPGCRRPRGTHGGPVRAARRSAAPPPGRWPSPRGTAAPPDGGPRSRGGIRPTKQGVAGGTASTGGGGVGSAAAVAVPAFPGVGGRTCRARTLAPGTLALTASISFGPLQRSFVPYVGNDVQAAGVRVELHRLDVPGEFGCDGGQDAIELGEDAAAGGRGDHAALGHHHRDRRAAPRRARAARGRHAVRGRRRVASACPSGRCRSSSPPPERRAWPGGRGRHRTARRRSSRP